MINQLKFCLQMIQRYERKYPNLPIDIVCDIVDVTLIRAPDKYFTWEQVQDHPEFCNKCGACCRTLNCDFFNGKTCNEYATRYDACTEFPWFEINGETGLMLDPGCNFAVKLAEMVLDKEFEHNIDLLEVD